jgi:hypothetical protein
MEHREELVNKDWWNISGAIASSAKRRLRHKNTRGRGRPHDKRVSTFLVLLLLLASLTIAQLTDKPSERPARYFPPGAIVYLEARDLNGLLTWWKSSDVRKNWEQSRNYEQFKSSRLYLKLRERITKWGAGGKFSFTLENLIQGSGGQSALALYDIGELRAIAAIKLPLAKAQASELWLARSRFIEKRMESYTYYVEPRNGVLNFAYVDPYLILSTEEDLLRQTLTNFSSHGQSLESSQRWQMCERQNSSDLSLFLDQEALQKNRYFQKYWIHRNVREFAGIQATWIDLSINGNSIVEQRYFARLDQTDQKTEVREYLKPFLQFRHEMFYLDAPVSSNMAANQVMRMINRLPQKDQRTSFPPTYSAAFERTTQAESRNVLLEQIDEPVLQVKSDTLLQADQELKLGNVLERAQPAAVIRLAYPLWDNQALFVRFPQTTIIHLRNFEALDQQAFLNETLKQSLMLQSTQDQGGRWKAEANGIYILESIHPLYLSFKKPWVIMSNEDSPFREITAKIPSDSALPNGRYREVNWIDGRWKYTRLMQRLDHGAYRSGDTPLLFSENIASLLQTLAMIEKSSIETSGNRQIVSYEIQK